MSVIRTRDYNTEKHNLTNFQSKRQHDTASQFFYSGVGWAPIDDV